MFLLESYTAVDIPATSFPGKRQDADSTILDSILNELEAAVRMD